MRDLLYSALCALMITAAACGGGGPPGGGNGNGDTDGGDETDGTTDNGGADGHVPNPNNPLIAVLRTTEWRATLVDGRPPDPPFGGSIWDVDADDPDCTHALKNSAEDYKSVGPPGDACIHWTLLINFVILDGSRVRHEDPIEDLAGNVLNDGRRIVLTLTNAELDTSAVIEYEKIE